MELCNIHDVAYDTRKCPACEAEDKKYEKIKELQEEIDQLKEEIEELQEELKHKEDK